MPITRINNYNDPRFSPEALRQHGCYLADGQACEVRIVSEDTAIVTGCPVQRLSALIEAFRFNAPHITRFTDAAGCILAELPPLPTFPVRLSDIQPSQFFVDEEKLAAVRSFIHAPEDIIVPVITHEGRYISLDGHTRLFLAAQQGWQSVLAVHDTADDVLLSFAKEASRRGVHTPADMTLLSHAEYEVRWNQFCDTFMAGLEEA